VKDHLRKFQEILRAAEGVTVTATPAKRFPLERELAVVEYKSQRVRTAHRPAETDLDENSPIS